MTTAARAARRVFLVSAPGLERSLERELQVLGVPGRLETTPGGVMVHGPQESLWRAVLQSRIAESAFLGLGSPFHAPDVRSLDAGLARVPWEDCIRLGQASTEEPTEEPAKPSGDLVAPMLPIVKVSTQKSRLYHTRLVEERVQAAIQQRRSGTGPVPSPRASPAEVRVRLRHDECQVTVAASGLLHQRGYRKAVSDLSVRETLAAACVLASPLLRRLTAAIHNDEELVLWDPFCGTGVLLLEALGIALGHPPGDRAKAYPFTSFPCHSSQEYAQLSKSIEPVLHAGLSRLTIIGSDSSEEQLGRAKRNLRRLLRRLRLPHSAGDDPAEALPCKVQLMQGPAAKVAHCLQGRPTLIVTNVPWGTASGAREDPDVGPPDAAATYAQLGRLLRQQKADWRGVYCLVASVEDFKTHTALDWNSELRFLSGGRWVDLLSWTATERKRR